ncbi:hypothetical protein EDD17DRAFT_1509753 [Pisolithus thermaeus]|nr:hypothetical protein EV401DRAFT_1890965 [Pisolithus croceorrhizus]KAI6160884.1 hypothetical protein EDD17DRAFT_1509753 [Pisolithus thermaeus]
MSFMDLLESSLNVDLESGHLPQPTANFPTLPNQSLLVLTGTTTVSEEQAAVPITPCKGGINPQEMTSVSLPTEDPPQALNDASWKSQNPGKPVIPPHSSKKLDVAQRAARKAAVEQRRVKQLAIADVVAKLLEEQETCINEIVKAHSVLLEKVRLLITRETHYRKRCEESLANTLVCIKAYLLCGQKFQLKELQEMVANDPDMQNLNEETKQKYLGELKESHSHKAATLKKIYGELQALTYHTGIYACLFVTCGHVYDMHTTTWFGMDNIMDFWEDQMKLSPDYIIKQLELWVCNEEKNIEAHNSLENMQKQAKNRLDSGFSSITKHLHQGKAVHLQFMNFEQIKYKFGIDYEGWPDGIPFSSPYKIQTVDTRHKAGETVGVPYQGCSDKEKNCKAANNEDTPQASKKAHRG